MPVAAALTCEGPTASPTSPLEGRHRQGVDHLLYRAWRGGAITVASRFDPLFASNFNERCFRFGIGSPWTIMHSKHPELRQAFHSEAAIAWGGNGGWAQRTWRARPSAAHRRAAPGWRPAHAAQP